MLKCINTKMSSPKYARIRFRSWYCSASLKILCFYGFVITYALNSLIIWYLCPWLWYIHLPRPFGIWVV